MPPLVAVKAIFHQHYEVTIQHPGTSGFVSVLAGLFTSFGMDIRSAHIEMLREGPIAVFEVKVAETPDWQHFEHDLSSYIQMLNGGKKSDVFSDINDRIIGYLRIHKEAYHEQIHPIEMEVDNHSSPSETIIDIRSQDTPAFLYELTTSLSVLGFHIKRMDIKTEEAEVRDRLWLVNESQGKITSEKQLRILQWAILLIKHFTHLLPKVPDPARAREAITLLGKDIFESEHFDEILLTLKESDTIEDLSKVLGTSKFVWEEFIRFQNESIFQILGDRQFLKHRKTKTEMNNELQNLLRKETSFDQRVEILNEFKDREMFRIDLRHILKKTSFLDEFAEEFSDLAEVVLEAGFYLAWDETAKNSLEPMIDVETKSQCCLCGLGKLGGRELGFASDLELIFIYSDDPDPASERSRQNIKFYTQLTQRFISMIHARSEGVFEIDLRLRPYGKDGPLAVSIDLFRKYYSPSGDSQNFERQALVKLRPLLGPDFLEKEILGIRDRFVYSGLPFDFTEAFELRKRQRQELVERDTLNAKYSKGGLLDVEYLVQTLQVVYGGRTQNPLLRQTNTLKAIEMLRGQGIVDEQTGDDLYEVYVFLRALIDALRIARGNAKDLTVLKWNSKASAVLARRMIYQKIDLQDDDDQVNQQLEKICSRSMQIAGRLYDEIMEKLRAEELALMEMTAKRPKKQVKCTSLDEILNDAKIEVARQALERLGFSDIDDSLARFKRLAKNEKCFALLAQLVRGADPLLYRVPDPDDALRYFERFSDQSSDKNAFWSSLIQTPRKITLLFTLFGSSRYLSDLLIEHPQYWQWVQDEKELTPENTIRELDHFSLSLDRSNLDDLRKFRQKETLRIALCDLILKLSLDRIHDSFSRLADFVIEKTTKVYCDEKNLSILALGKLGGMELNFSSDIDLMFVSDRQDAAMLKDIQNLCHAFSKATTEGFLYRTDLRLRPNGTAGALYLSYDDTIKYYQQNADAWEYQMLIKARPVSGNKSKAQSFIQEVQPLCYREIWPRESINRIQEIKRLYESETFKRGETNTSVKLGAGGIRDIEFSIQMIQLLHGFKHVNLRQSSTLKALDEIERNHLLAEDDCSCLREGYIFLRQIENRIHLYENRQEFNIPGDPKRLRSLIKSLNFIDDNNSEAIEKRFFDRLNLVKENCRTIFERIFFNIT